MSFIFPVVSATECDVHESGLDRAGREVAAAYLKCKEGRIIWKHPRNGLRILLKSPKEGKDFKACIKADPGFGGARVLVEGNNTLIPLLAVGDRYHLEEERCAVSDGGVLALYMEADISVTGFNNHVASFMYDLQPLPNGVYYHPDYDCQPCSEQELLDYYCSADFIAIGSLSGVEHITKSPQSYNTLNFLTPSPLGSLYSHENHAPHIRGAAFLNFHPSKVIREPYSEVNYDRIFEAVSRRRGSPTKISVPKHCDMKADGIGEVYLLMGRVKLRSPSLLCVPTLKQFKSLVSRREKDAPCHVYL